MNRGKIVENQKDQKLLVGGAVEYQKLKSLIQMMKINTTMFHKTLKILTVK